MKLLSKLSLCLFLTSFCLAAHGQKPDIKRLKVKKGQVYYDGMLFLEIPMQGLVYRVCAPGKTRPLITARIADYINPQERSTANPKGRVGYIELRFSGAEESDSIRIAEIAISRSNIRKVLAITVIDYELIMDDELSIENVNEFVNLTGTPYTEEKSRIQIIDRN